MLVNESLFGLVNISQTDIDELLEIDEIYFFQPAKNIFVVCLCQARDERHWHSMDSSTETGLRSVDVCMCVDPQDSQFGPCKSLPDSPCHPRDRSDSNRMVTSERHHELPLPCVGVDMLAYLLGSQADNPWSLHAVDIWVAFDIGVLLAETVE